jgi:hypothetical protein
MYFSEDLGDRVGELGIGVPWLKYEIFGSIQLLFKTFYLIQGIQTLPRYN